MRRILLLLLLAVTLIPAELSAQMMRDSVISVSAMRTTRLAPDRVSFYLIVEGTAETAADAVTRAESKLKAVTDAVRSLPQRPLFDAPVAYGVTPSPMQQNFQGMTAPSTHLARTLVRVQLTRPEALASVVAAALAAGAAGSTGVSFESSAADSVRRARVAEVINVARQDAEVAAAALGARLGALVSVSVSGGPVGYSSSSIVNFDNRFTPQAQAPEITVHTSVSAQYRLVR